MALQAEQIADLVTSTLKELGRMKWSDISTDLQKHIALRRLLKKYKTQFDGGTAVQFSAMTGHNESARFVGLGATDIANIKDVMTTGSVPWRHCTWNWSIIRQELSMNSGPAKIVSLIQERRVSSQIAAAEMFERRFWRVPAITDEVNPYGVPTYIVKNNTEGFNGTVPSGYTTVAGISTTTYPRWKNYTFQYTSPSKDDLVKKWRVAAMKTDWEPPVENIPEYNTGDDYGFYSNLALVETLVDLLEAQNENLGNDLASMSGKVMFMRRPVEWVPALDDDTTNPIYGINWGEFKTIGLRGEWMVETKIPVVPGQHTVSTTHTDCTVNWICRNRRRQFVGATDVTLPA